MGSHAGSGKTRIAVAAMLEQREQVERADGLALLLAPTEALCLQVSRLGQGVINSICALQMQSEEAVEGQERAGASGIEAPGYLVIFCGLLQFKDGW